MKKIYTFQFNSLILLLLLLFSINSCKREELQPEQQPDQSLIESSKTYFEKNVLNTTYQATDASAANKSKRQLIAKTSLWNQAFIKKTSLDDAVMVPLQHERTLAAKDKKATGSPLNIESYLMIYRDKDQQYHTEVITRIPDENYWNHKNDKAVAFTGTVLIEDWQGNAIKSYLYRKENDGVKVYVSKPVQKGDVKVNGNISLWICNCTDWYQDFGNGWEYVDTTCDCFEQYPSGGGGGGTGGGGTGPGDYDPQHGGGGSGGAEGGIVDDENLSLSMQDLESATFVPDPKPSIQNIDKYINCFTDGKTASSYKLTIYVDQPIAGKNDQFLLQLKTGIGINITGVIHDVGHTFVAFEKINTDGTRVRQVMGFYPENDPFNTSPKGVIKDDSGHAYDVSYSKTVDAYYFSEALNRVKYDYNNMDYRLSNVVENEYNCTDAAKLWLFMGGASLPSAPRGAFENTPGDFGQALRNKPGAKLTYGTAPAGKGPCN
ncbi:MAG: hypothetical protein WBP45_01740 [Daejeonella sp.]